MVLIVVCIGMISSKMLGPARTVSRHLQSAWTDMHEHHRRAAFVPFEDAILASYLSNCADMLSTGSCGQSDS